MLVEIVAGRKIPIGTVAEVNKIYYYEIPGTKIKVKRVILYDWGSTDWINVKVIDRSKL